MENLQESDRGTSVSQPNIRLAYLDGLLRLAAFYVICYHLEREINWRLEGKLPLLVQKAMKCLAHGRFAVAAFIVLSGYCLMLPIVNSANRQFRSDLLNYFKRVASLGLAVLLCYCFHVVFEPPFIDNHPGKENRSAIR